MVKPDILLSSLLAGLVCVAPAIAHPGEYHSPEDIALEIESRNVHAEYIARGLEKCVGTESYEQMQQESSRRLAKKAVDLRAEMGINPHLPFKTRRSLAALEAFEKVNHNKTSSGFTESTKPKKLFASYKNVSCILTPEVTQGPYWITGEPIRTNVRQGQAGVPVHLEYRFIDTSTCKPAAGLYVDTWQANATGVYSGIVASGNGNSNDKANINSTALRGMQKTGIAGVVAFDTIFAGHYTGRATHIHLIAQHNGTVYSNDTYHNGVVSHVGQIFFPEDLRTAVEKLSPYSTNTQASTTNDADMWAPSQAANNYDPFPDYAYVGDTLADGLLMWISVGIDLSAVYTPTAAGAWTANGGTSTSTSGGGPPK